MDIFISLKSLINKVNEFDKKYKNITNNSNLSSNPFAFKENKTFAWVENPPPKQHCKYKQNDS